MVRSEASPALGRKKARNFFARLSPREKKKKMANRPRFKYPDFNLDVSKGNIPDGPGDIEAYFGKSKYENFKASENMPVDALTLQKAYEGNNTFITNILHLNFVNGDGWWAGLLPVRRVEGMNQDWAIITYPRQSMEPAPEETTPRLVKFSKEDHSESLTRYSIGAKAYHDFYKTAEGQASIEADMGAMVSGGWIAAKLLVSQAVFNSKMHWQEYQKQYGPSYGSVMDALADEINLYGALSKDEKGIYKLHSYAEEVTKEANPPFDMIIVGKGSLNFIVFSGSYETESFRRGESVTQQRLTLGSKSVTNLFPGITIYEDEVFALTNVGPDEINQFTRISMIGRYFMVDGSDFGQHMKEYPTAKMLSVDAVSMDIDDWRRFGINTLIDSNMRWKEDGTLTDSLARLAQDPDAVLQRSGSMKLHDPAYLDPYIWLDDAGQYHTIKHWGDMDKAFLSFEQTKLHGEMAAKNIMASLTDDQRKDFRELQTLKERLYTVPDVLEESFQGYVFATTASPENRTGGADFAKYNSFMLKPNRFGSSQIPHVDRTPRQSNNAAGAELDLPNGALYVKEGQKRLYIWAIYPETISGSTHSFRVNDPFTKNEGTTTSNAARNLPAARFSSFTPFSQPDVPYAYITAPFDAFGAVDTKGRAPWFDDHINVASAWHSVGWQRIKGTAGEGTAVTGGIQPPRLVRAPPIPFGAGLISGLRQLSQMHAEGDCRGWNETICTEAAKGIRVMDEIASMFKKMYPECELMNEKYVPYYMRSTDKNTNVTNSIFANLWDSVKYPLWARIPRVNKNTLANGEEMTILVTDIRDTKGTVRGIEEENLRDIKVAMGFTANDRGAMSLRTELGGTVPVAEPGAVDALIRDVVNSDRIDPGLLNTLKDSERGNAATKLFKTYSSSSQTGLGQAYKNHLATKHGVANADMSFAWFVDKELLAIGRRSGINAAVKVFNTVLGLALAAVHGVSPKRYTAEQLAQVVAAAEHMGSQDISREDDNNNAADKLIEDAQSGSGSKSPFINTRLAISPDSFSHLYDLVKDADSNDIIIVQSANSVVRPSDPRNASKPAAGHSPLTINPLDSDAVKAAQASFQFAKAPGSGRGRGLESTTLTHESLIREFANLGGLEYNDEDDTGLDSNPYTRKRKRHIPDSMTEDVTGPLYENITEKKWLVRRFEAMSKDLAGNDLARMAAHLLCLTRVTKKSLKDMIKADLPIPDSCYIIAQPFVQIRTSAGVWAVKGPATGETAYNYEDVVLQFNGQNKTWHMHYTIWMNAAVYDPTMLLIIKDIRFEGYIGGMDGTINTEGDLKDWDPTSIDWARVKSCFVFSCGSLFTRNVARQVANPLCLFGKYDPRALPVNFANRNRVFDPDGPLWPSFPFYNLIWGFTDMNNMTLLNNTSYAGLKESTYVTGLMPMCNHRTYDPNTGDWTKEITGTGHLDCLKPPMLQILNGKVQFRCDKQ